MVLVETTGEDSIYYLHGLDLIAQSDGTNTEYFAYDGLGSVRQVVDEAAGVLLAQTYDPYGGVYASAGPGETHFGWTGEQVDASGLVYLRARYYSPGMGRFLSADPSRAEMNPYWYGAGNPVYYLDLSGLIPQYPDMLEGTLIHQMIEADFMEWGARLGRIVGFEVYIDSASREASRLVTEEGIVLRVPIPEVLDPNPGRADLVDFSRGQVYEIKTVATAEMGIATADADWYRWHLNTDPQYGLFGPWELGTDYLSSFRYPGEGDYIGFWPTDITYEVRAVYMGPGAIGYYARRSQNLDPVYILVWLAMLEALLRGACEETPALQPAPASPPLLVPYFFFDCEFNSAFCPEISS